MSGRDERTGRRVQSVADLDREIPPRRDLWPAIEAGLVPRRRTTIPPPRWTLGLAAGVVLVAVGFWVGRATLPGAPVAATPSTAATATVEAPGQAEARSMAAFGPGASYETAREAALAALPDRLARLPWQTREQVLASLATVQRSIAEIELALGRDPGNALLQSLLIDGYQEEMRVLSTLDTAGEPGQEI